jgi:hypothetical protein
MDAHRGSKRGHLLLWTTALTLGAAWALLGGCNGSSDGSDASAGDDAAPSDATSSAFDLCDAFTGVGTACPVASPERCFPLCEAGGCFCSATDGGPRWSCVNDLSCQPPCSPLDPCD